MSATDPRREYGVMFRLPGDTEFQVQPVADMAEAAQVILDLNIHRGARGVLVSHTVTPWEVVAPPAGDHRAEVRVTASCDPETPDHHTVCTTCGVPWPCTPACIAGLDVATFIPADATEMEAPF